MSMHPRTKSTSVGGQKEKTRLQDATIFPSKYSNKMTVFLLNTVHVQVENVS